MVVNVIIRRMAGALVAASLLATGVALEMPPEVEDAFRGASVGESGGLYAFDDGRERIVAYVTEHWGEVLDHLGEIPTDTNNPRVAIAVVGAAAEELPPMEYLDFLDQYLTIYSQGTIDDKLLLWQLGGFSRKDDFLTVNAKHARVQALLKRAKGLVPKENSEVQRGLDRLLSGEGSDIYMVDRSDDAPLPETLPGIKLRPPFESILDKVTRLGKANDGAAGHSGRGSAGQSEAEAAANEGGGGGRLWGVAVALAILAFALWRAFFKRRLAGASR